MANTQQLGRLVGQQIKQAAIDKEDQATGRPPGRRNRKKFLKNQDDIDSGKPLLGKGVGATTGGREGRGRNRTDVCRLDGSPVTRHN